MARRFSRTVPLVALAAAVAACSSSPARQPCEVTPACFQGDFVHDCGQDGEPVLGCSPDACYWFADGCVPAAFTPSDCPADDICCHDDWPFEMSEPGDLLSHQLDGYGTEPWTRDRGLAVDVEILESVAGDEWFDCDGVDPYPGSATTCTGWTRTDFGSARLADTLRIAPAVGGFGGWYPLIEVDFELGAARVCTARFTDSPSARCSPHPVHCAASGTVWLSTRPATPDDLIGLRARIDVEFPELPLHLTGAFTVAREGY